MSNYIEVLKVAIISFPFIALVISLPFILSQYHKFGSISMLKVLIIYSLALYLTCAYFLVILPLPNRDEVAAMTTPRVQLVPFDFVADFVQHSSLNILDPNTYLSAFTESYFYVPIYNILLTLPFGIYLRYYFNCSLKKTVVWTFFLSLFFELTQLSGLYFVYPRGYRLFDVDDLMLNTLGGALGYLVAAPLAKFLPSRDAINEETREKGKAVSGFRRTTAFVLDLVVYATACTVAGIIFGGVEDAWMITIITLVVYYFIMPIFWQGATLGEKFLNLQIVNLDNQPRIQQILWRRTLFLIIYIGLPRLFFELSALLISQVLTNGLLTIIVAGSFFVFYIITGIKFLLTNKPMLYEKLSQTRFSSTIK